MKMKLNDKGANRIDLETMEYDPRDHEFEMDDFDGVVVFELNDAKAILCAYKALAKIYEALEVPYAVETAQEAIATIEYRIAQAESSTK